MKLITPCNLCVQNYEKTKPDIVKIAINGELESHILFPKEFILEYSVTDELVYKLKCNFGHSFNIIHIEDKFEFLYQSAVSAYLDGYFREAVSTMAVCLERFYEFAIKVMCHSTGIGINNDNDEFTKTWKLIKPQSERQLGAFYFLFLLITKKSPPFLANSFIEFRNNVIHKGGFPSKEETFEYLTTVLKIIYEISRSLSQHSFDSFSTVYEEANKNLAKEYRAKGESIWEQQSVSSIVSSVLRNLDEATIESTIAKITTIRELFRN